MKMEYHKTDNVPYLSVFLPSKLDGARPCDHSKRVNSNQRGHSPSRPCPLFTKVPNSVGNGRGTACDDKDGDGVEDAVDRCVVARQESIRPCRFCPYRF